MFHLASQRKRMRVERNYELGLRREGKRMRKKCVLLGKSEKKDESGKKL